MKKTVPIILPTLVDYRSVEKEFREVRDSGQVTVSKYTELFEKQVCRTLGVKNAIAVSSCTSGLILAVKALDLKGEVIVPAFTFAATAHALAWNKITPVFCDSEKGTYNIDVKKVEPLINGKTSAIMPVYIFGVPPRITELEKLAKKYNMKLLFDSAQGLGARYKGRLAGGFGNAEVFSMSSTKVVTSIEGGLVTTGDDDLAGKIRQMRDYGKSFDGEGMDYVGLSARMSEFHSIIGMRNFSKMEQLIKRRKKLIAHYKKNLEDVKGISFQKIPSCSESTGNYKVIFIDEKKARATRDEVYQFMKEKRIQTKKYFYPALHMQKAYAQFKKKYQGLLPVAEKASKEGLALPLYSHMNRKIVSRVCTELKKIL